MSLLAAILVTYFGMGVLAVLVMFHKHGAPDPWWEGLIPLALGPWGLCVAITSEATR